MILFVCHGNAARSQFAEAFLKQKGFTDVQSAGTHVSESKRGIKISDDGPGGKLVVENFRQITGIDISGSRRKQLNEEAANRADKIIVLTEKEHLPEFMEKYLFKTEFWKIDDPHNMNFDVYKKIVSDIQTGVDNLIKNL